MPRLPRPAVHTLFALALLAAAAPRTATAGEAPGLSPLAIPRSDWVLVHPFAHAPGYTAYGPRAAGFVDGCADAGTCTIDAAPLPERPVSSLTSASGCDPNYAGACVPIARDVDCTGKGGNGPAFVQGPFRVIGVDIYGLDEDEDGIACEPLHF